MLEDIDRLLYRDTFGEQPKIREFTIGKTYAPLYKRKRGKGWKVKGISDRWDKKYKPEGYDFLLAFVILTRENIPERAKDPFKNQQMLALALESQLIQHFAFVKQDPRLGNASLEPGRLSGDYAGQVLYIAVRYTKQDEDEEILDPPRMVSG